MAPQVCCLEGQPQGPALACQRDAQGTHRAREPYGQRRVGWTSVGRPDKARGRRLRQRPRIEGCPTQAKQRPSAHAQGDVKLEDRTVHAIAMPRSRRGTIDMLIERHQRKQTSEASFPQAQDRAKDLGNEEGWPIVGGTMGAARAKLCAADTELLYLYGFVMNDNPDDYLMFECYDSIFELNLTEHQALRGPYGSESSAEEAIQKVDFSESKTQLLEAQKAELRCLLPRSLLNRGFFPPTNSSVEGKDKSVSSQVSNYSWSGQRRTPSYLHKLVFPADFLNALRTLAMKENELYHVSSLLEELVGSGGERQPTDTEVQAAIWEACGDSGALQLLVDLLNMKMLDLKEGSGTEDNDTELLEKALTAETSEDCREASGIAQIHLLSRNKRSSIIYRRGQKQLTRLFLKEAEHALQLALTEEL
ncbi:putative SPX domain-containing membrane protein-like [Capsicum annuum]|nr:putative SPX domain-containing membrane protein-like [Capsicum annuum]